MSASLHIDMRAGFPYMWNQGAGPECVSDAVAGLFAWKLRKAGRTVYQPSRRFNRFNSLTADKQAAIRAAHGKAVRLEDIGTSLDTALESARQQGMCSEALWPQSERFDRAPSGAAYQEAFRHRILESALIAASGTENDLAAIRAYLIAGEPLLAAFLMTDHLRCDEKHNLVGPYTSVAGAWTGSENHAAIIMGLDDARGAFLIRNSWGAHWQDAGHCWMSYALAKQAQFLFRVFKMGQLHP